MKTLRVSVRRIGNSQGVVIPKTILLQLGLSGETGVEMAVEGDALVLRRPTNPARRGWAEAAKAIAECGDDALAMGEFGNAEDEELHW
jgi:antitoxin MazE